MVANEWTPCLQAWTAEFSLLLTSTQYTSSMPYLTTQNTCINRIYIGRHLLTIVPHHITSILFYVHPENQASLQGYTHSPSIQCIGSKRLLYLYAHSEYSSQVECIEIGAISLVEELVWVHVYWWSMFRSLSMKVTESAYKNMEHVFYIGGEPGKVPTHVLITHCDYSTSMCSE